MKLQLTLTEDNREWATIDNVEEMAITFITQLDECSVHAWFKFFERVLGAAGFNEHAIMTGACQLAFNDCRPQDIMKKLSHDYDLCFEEPTFTDDND